ncbi:hypothetical protein VCHC32A1_3271, partial [Vibrio cholerae HC-32A1]
MLLLCLSLVV